MPGTVPLDVRDFIRAFGVFAPNGSKPVTEVREGDVVVLGRQACEVVELSKPFSTKTPLDFDKSTKPKAAVMIRGKSILWPSVEYESTFLYHDVNKIGTFSGEPDIHEGTVVDIKRDIMTIKDEHGQTRSLEIPDNKIGRSIRLLYGVDEEVVVRVSSFFGAVWPSGIKPKTPRSASGGGSGDPVKIGNKPDVKPESSTEGSRKL